MSVWSQWLSSCFKKPVSVAKQPQEMLISTHTDTFPQLVKMFNKHSLNKFIYLFLLLFEYSSSRRLSSVAWLGQCVWGQRSRVTSLRALLNVMNKTGCWRVGVAHSSFIRHKPESKICVCRKWLQIIKLIKSDEVHHIMSHLHCFISVSLSRDTDTYTEEKRLEV